MIKGNDGETIIPNGGHVHDEIFINIYGSEVENNPEIEVGYLYSDDNGTTWKEYGEILHYDGEGEITILAKAYLVEDPTMESDITSYTVTIDRTSPDEKDVIVPDETDTVHCCDRMT